MATDWDKLEEEYNKGEFKDYAPLGTYKVKIVGVEVDSTTNGTDYVRFEAEETEEYQFPKSSQHWLSKKKVGWRKWHHKNLLVALGATEANARAAIDKVDYDGVSDVNLITGYRKVYETIVAKKPVVEVVVREQYNKNGEVSKSKKGVPYTEFEFTDKGVFIDNTPKDMLTTPVEEAMGETEELDNDLEIPFL